MLITATSMGLNGLWCISYWSLKSSGVRTTPNMFAPMRSHRTQHATLLFSCFFFFTVAMWHLNHTHISILSNSCQVSTAQSSASMFRNRQAEQHRDLYTVGPWGSGGGCIATLTLISLPFCYTTTTSSRGYTVVNNMLLKSFDWIIGKGTLTMSVLHSGLKEHKVWVAQLQYAESVWMLKIKCITLEKHCLLWFTLYARMRLHLFLYFGIVSMSD